MTARATLRNFVHRGGSSRFSNENFPKAGTVHGSPKRVFSVSSTATFIVDCRTLSEFPLCSRNRTSEQRCLRKREKTSSDSKNLRVTRYRARGYESSDKTRANVRGCIYIYVNVARRVSNARKREKRVAQTPRSRNASQTASQLGDVTFCKQRMKNPTGDSFYPAGSVIIKYRHGWYPREYEYQDLFQQTFSIIVLVTNFYLVLTGFYFNLSSKRDLNLWFYNHDQFNFYLITHWLSCYPYTNEMTSFRSWINKYQRRGIEEIKSRQDSSIPKILKKIVYEKNIDLFENSTDIGTQSVEKKFVRIKR